MRVNDQNPGAPTFGRPTRPFLDNRWRPQNKKAAISTEWDSRCRNRYRTTFGL